MRCSNPDCNRGEGPSGRLFVLELRGGRIHSMKPDGSDGKAIVSNCRLPDGIVVDVGAGHIHWTTMGKRRVYRARKIIVPLGRT